MRYLITFLFAVISFNAVGQINQNFNPDYNGDGFIGVDDILGVLSSYDTTWESDIVYGCTYPSYIEYNPIANYDDGSCLIISEPGCTDSSYCNYNSEATEDDGSCLSLDECGVCGGGNSTCYTCGDLVTHEGYDYSTVQIGDKCWFSENCRYLPSVSPRTDLSGVTPHYYVYAYEGFDVTAAQMYGSYSNFGVLYNWPAVMTAGICPSGWHVPTDGEFTQLTDFLGGETVAGYAMKSTTGWNDINGDFSGNGSNSSGFNGLPGGLNTGYWYNASLKGYWWSSSVPASGGSLTAWRRQLVYSAHNVDRESVNRSYGLSVRCLRDYTDDCGVLNGDNSTCSGCDGVPNSGIVYDDCGICGGDGSTCVFQSCGDDIGYGNYSYSTVQIGEQCWFSENCRYLPSVSPSSSNSGTAPHYYVYGFDGTDVTAAQMSGSYSDFGVLYNWPAVMAAGICPSGWHVPTDGEFTQLTDFLGGETVAGYAMKSNTGWAGLSGSNSSGFNAFPRGGITGALGFFGAMQFGFWWSSSVPVSGDGSSAWMRQLVYSSQNVDRDSNNRSYGFSARCLRD